MCSQVFIKIYKTYILIIMLVNQKGKNIKKTNRRTNGNTETSWFKQPFYLRK